jgi:O-antigen ligase
VRAPIPNVGPLWGPRVQSALVVLGAAVLAVWVGMQVSRGDGSTVAAPVIGLAAIAGAIVLFSVPVEKVFLGWLLVAPLFQGPADETSIGRPLSFAFYLAPPLVIAVQTAMQWRRRRDESFVDLLPALFLGYVVFSAFLTSPAAGENPTGLLKELFQVTAIGVLTYYFVVFGPGARVPGRAIVKVVFLGAILQALLALVEWPTGWGLWGTSGWHSADPPRAVATLASPGALGTYLGCAIVVALAVLAWEGPVALRRMSWLVLLVGIPGLLVTVTRGPILAGVIAGLGVLLLAPRGRLVGLGLVAASAIALVAAWPQLTQAELYQKRIAEQTNIAGREDVQDASLAAAAEKPVLGWGYGSFDRAKLAVADEISVRVEGSLETTSHNGLLTILVEFGAVGLLLLLAPWTVIALRGVGLVRRHVAERWLLVGSIAALAVFVLNAMTTDLKYFSLVSALPWLFVGLVRRASDEDGATSTS